MSLSKWSGVHPYVTDRVRYLLRIADRYGSRYRVISGKRNARQQWGLWNAKSRFPAAFPGCSQHEYGLAMDVQFDSGEWQRWYQASAKNIGLTTIRNDPHHVQAVPASVIRPILEREGLCPNPQYLEARYWTPKAICRRSGESWAGSGDFVECIDPNDPFPRKSF